MAHSSTRSVVSSSRIDHFSRALMVLVLATWSLFLTWQPALSDDVQVQPTSFIAPLEQRRPYRLIVIGDSVGANLADGLRWTFRRDDNVKVRKRTKAGTGFVRTDQYNWQRVIHRIARRKKADIIVMLNGGNDRQDLRVRGRRYVRFTPKWRAAYIQRLDRAARLLRKSGTAVYWVGLPNVRSSRMSRDYVRFNSYYKQVSRKYGLKYIDIRDLFLTRTGGYSDFGRDLRGRRTRLRSRDGIHLTNAGSKVLGRYIADRILDDMPRRVSKPAKTSDARTYARKKVTQ